MKRYNDLDPETGALGGFMDEAPDGEWVRVRDLFDPSALVSAANASRLPIDGAELREAVALLVGESDANGTHSGEKPNGDAR